MCFGGGDVVQLGLAAIAAAGAVQGGQSGMQREGGLVSYTELTTSTHSAAAAAAVGCLLACATDSTINLNYPLCTLSAYTYGETGCMHLVRCWLWMCLKMLQSKSACFVAAAAAAVRTGSQKLVWHPDAVAACLLECGWAAGPDVFHLRICGNAAARAHQAQWVGVKGGCLYCIRPGALSVV